MKPKDLKYQAIEPIITIINTEKFDQELAANRTNLYFTMLAIKIFLLGFLLVAVPLRASYCSEQAQKQEVSTVSGRIAVVNWVGSSFTIRIIFLGSIADEMVFNISRDTKITKGGYSLTLGELQVQDYVTIEYLDQSFQGLSAMRIMVNI